MSVVLGASETIVFGGAASVTLRQARSVIVIPAAVGVAAVVSPVVGAAVGTAVGGMLVGGSVAGAGAVAGGELVGAGAAAGVPAPQALSISANKSISRKVLPRMNIWSPLQK